MRSDDPTQPPDQTTAPHHGAIGAPIGGTLGRFRVDGMLGRGGMGIVLDAYDPELARAVAVKLLRPDVWGTATEVDRARLQREAQAMAKLSHPNVVTVYEVGEVDGQAFLAMERVDGETLRAWQGHKRTPAQILAMYVAVGRGLAAAHAAGLVHRDFKPENVMVGRDGRGRVGDFGLVAAGVAIDVGDAHEAPVGVNLSVRGSMMGTPAYMAPEQWAGEDIDARTDQFAFAVALWEAIYGERPFAGDDGPAIRAAVLAGERRPPRRGAQAPSWLWPILVRALERDPDRRWPTLAAMLEELERRSRPSRAPVLAAGAGAALGTVAVVVALATGPKAAGASCPTPSAAGVWDAAAQARLRDHLRGLDTVRGEKIFIDLARFADRHVAAWQSMHVQSCKLTRDGGQSDTLHDQRSACLDDRRDELAHTEALTLAVGAPGQLESALTAWKELSPVDDCADVELVSSFAPPPTAAARPEARSIADELRAIEVARRAGQLDGLLARGEVALVRARALAYPPLLATALYRVASIALGRAEAPAAIAHLHEATAVAAAAGEDGLAAAIWLELLKLIAFDQGKPADAQALLVAARAVVARAGSRLTDRVGLLLVEVDILQRLAKSDDALAKVAEARRLLETDGAATPGSPHRILLVSVLKKSADIRNLRSKPEDREAAVAIYREAIAMLEEELGPGHPDLAVLRVNQGEALRKLGRLDDALRVVGEAVRIREEHLGDSPGLALALAAYGNVLREQGKLSEASKISERALAMVRATTTDRNLLRFQILNGVGAVYLQEERDAEARAVLDEGIAVGDRLDPVANTRPMMLWNRADLDVKVGDCASALPRFQRARELFEDFLGKDTYFLIGVQRRIAQCQLSQRDFDAALASIERALALPPPPNQAREVMVAHHVKAEALIRSGRDGAAGRALMAATRAEAVALGAAGIEQHDLIVKWLATYAR